MAQKGREHWGSNLGFILAAAGSAVGLGNIWKFPYITGENGGGAFVLIYLLCILIIGLPVMLCEIIIGRRTQRNPVGAFAMLRPRSSTLAHLLGGATILTGIFLLVFQYWGWAVLTLLLGAAIFRYSWTVVGAMGVVAGFVILSFYSVVAGWTIGYTWRSATAQISTHPEKQSAELLAHVLLNNIRNPTADQIDVIKAQKLPIIEEQQALEEAAQVQAAGYLEREFQLQLDLDEQELNNYQFNQYLVGFLTERLSQEKLLDHLAEHHFDGRKQVVDEAGTTASEYPKSFHTAIAGTQFDRFMKNGWYALGFHLLFMSLCIAIVCFGVQGGIEKASKILMPTLLLLIIALIVRGLTLPGAIKGVQFYLSPDFSKLNPQSVLIALGHAFFSLSLGMGAIITYGSYVEKEQNIFLSTLSIVALDTLIALLAGLAIFPAVFAVGFDPSAGPGLVFQILPAVFNRMPYGFFWATLFFLLLLVAALTSGVSLLEVVTAYFVDEHKWSRQVAAIVVGIVIFVLGAFAALSVADWTRILWLQRTFLLLFGTVKGSFFDVLDNMGSNWLLPLGGLFISVFVGWVWGTKRAVDEVRHGSHNFADVHLISLLAGLKDDESHNSSIHVVTLASVWGIFIRFVSPLAVLIAFLDTVGWLNLTKSAEPASSSPAAEEVQQQAEAPSEK